MNSVDGVDRRGEVQGLRSNKESGQEEKRRRDKRIKYMINGDGG